MLIIQEANIVKPEFKSISLGSLDRQKYTKDNKVKESQSKTETATNQKENEQKEAIERLKSKIEEYSRKEESEDEYVKYLKNQKD